MLFYKSHGGAAGSAQDLPEAQTCGLAAPEAAPSAQSPAPAPTPSPAPTPAPGVGPFDYFFPDAPALPEAPDVTARLDALAAAMVEDPAPASNDSRIPPVFTYFGQFIDHDVTANTDRDGGLSRIDVDQVHPAPRADVAAQLGNLRMGALNLDSLYGGVAAPGSFAARLDAALRHPADPAKLRIGTLHDAGLGETPLPEDPAGDLLRVDALLRGPRPALTAEALRALPEPMRSLFVNPDDTIRVQRAVIGDSRNDENLAVAQLHLAFARLHNRIADQAAAHGVDAADRDAVFAWARRMTTFHYQWLVLHVYLPMVCDPAVVRRVLAEGAPVYGAFLDRVGAPGAGRLPVPLEFSVAAFRFGHSMVRAEYDWSRFFGRPVGNSASLAPRAAFPLLFAFTGGAVAPMPLPGGGAAPRLPGHWSVEWDRLALPVDDAFPDRAARKIDVNIALPLNDLVNDGPPGVMRMLAARNLRRGLRLSIPTAQGCLAALNDGFEANLPPLSRAQIARGPLAPALSAGGFDLDTPLWFYVLREAEILGGGEHLGPLGSRLVAETLAGLVIHDPQSFWNQPGSDRDGRWRPEDGVLPDGVLIEDMPSMLRAAALL